MKSIKRKQVLNTTQVEDNSLEKLRQKEREAEKAILLAEKEKQKALREKEKAEQEKELALEREKKVMKKLALKMLKYGEPLDEIVKETGLSLEEIENLKKFIK